MITTNDRDEMQPFPFMRLPGIKSWKAVGLELRKPYFVLNYGCKGKSTWITQAAILWQEDDLLAFCKEANANPEIRIYQIAMMAPPISINPELWRWKVLSEIWGRDKKVHLLPGMLYVSVEGDRLFSPHLTMEEQQLNFTQAIYKMVDMSTET